MITYEDVMHISFLKKSPFKGSDTGMRYLMRAVRDGDGNITALEAVHWPEPFNWEKTPEEKKTGRSFAFSDDGIREAVAWLNAEHGPEGQDT